jgi:hypothetical protein
MRGSRYERRAACTSIRTDALRSNRSGNNEGSARTVRDLTSCKIAKYVALAGFGAGALLIFWPMVSPTVGRWLLSMGVISGVTAERMAWGPMALFATLIPGSIAICIGLVSLTIAIVLRAKRSRLQQ